MSYILINRQVTHKVREEARIETLEEPVEDVNTLPKEGDIACVEVS
jgi:hypothetical protein